MKLVSFIKKALILCVFFIFVSLLPVPMLTIPGATAIAEASENSDNDNSPDAKLNVKSISLVKENSYTLRVYNTTDSMDVSFKSNDRDLVSVSQGNGNTATVTGINVGTTTVTVTVKEGRKTIQTLECEITVGPPLISYKLPEKIFLGVGKKRTLAAIIKPSNSTEMPIFSSDNTDVATVNYLGRVTAKSEGTAIIKAKLANGKEFTCTVVVDGSNEGDND